METRDIHHHDVDQPEPVIMHQQPMTAHHAATAQHPALDEDELTIGKILQWSAMMGGAAYSAIAVRQITSVTDAVDRALWQFLWILAILIAVMVYVVGGAIHAKVVEARHTISTEPSRRMQRWLASDRS